MCLVFSGALTSKPYAFTARPWELKVFGSIDFLDGLATPISVCCRGVTVMRVLPQRGGAYDDEWITDKIRFVYDGLRNQRLVRPFKRQWSNGLEYLSSLEWPQLSIELDNFLLLNKTLRSVTGSFVDLETLSLLKERILSTSQVGFSVFCLLSGGLINTDFRASYVFDKGARDFQNFDCIFLLGGNLRLEYPLINVKLRSARRSKPSLMIVSWGFQHDVENVFLGVKLNSLINVLNGSSIFSPFFVLSSDVLVISGLESMAALDYYLFKSLLFKISGLCRLSCSVLLPYISMSGFYELGLNYYSDLRFDPAAVNFAYFFDFDEERALEKGFYDYYDYDYVIYQGHHGDEIALLSDIVLPGVLPFEKNCSFFDIFGQYKKIDYLISPQAEARVDWKIFDLFFYYMGYGFCSSVIEDFYKFVNEIKYLAAEGLGRDEFVIFDRFFFSNECFALSEEDLVLDTSLARNSLVLNLLKDNLSENKNIWK